MASDRRGVVSVIDEGVGLPLMRAAWYERVGPAAEVLRVGEMERHEAVEGGQVGKVVVTPG